MTPKTKVAPRVLGAHRGGLPPLPRTPPELTGGLPPPGPPWEVAALRVCMNFLACVSYRGALPPGPPWEVAALRVCMNLYTF